VQIVEGEETNLKVTTPVDLALAEFILRQRTDKSK
jgi:2-C-methyl-D-erythritol 4-phosphate cytidylyltransferase